MVQIDMNEPDRDLNPGIDLWSVIASSEERASSGNKMIKLKLARVSHPNEHLFDNIMLSGGGWPIGKGKLQALLPADFKGDLDPLDFIGRRLWVATGVETYNGRDSLKVMIDQLKHKGYQREDDVPPGCVVPEEHDEIPF